MAVGLLLIWGASVVNASDVDWDVAAGVAVPFTSGYNLGFGGEGTAGFNIAPSLDLTGSVGFYTFSVTGGTSSASASSSSIEFLAGLKYFLGGSSMPGVKPYLIGQAGLSDLNTSITVGSISGSASSIYPEIAGGAGLDFSLGDASKIGIIVQSKVAVVLGNGGSFTYLPVVGGVSF